MEHVDTEELKEMIAYLEEEKEKATEKWKKKQKDITRRKVCSGN